MWWLFEISVCVLVIIFVFFAVFGVPKLDGFTVQLQLVTVGHSQLWSVWLW